MTPVVLKMETIQQKAQYQISNMVLARKIAGKEQEQQVMRIKRILYYFYFYSGSVGYPNFEHRGLEFGLDWFRVSGLGFGFYSFQLNNNACVRSSFQW